jgi:hypothetical protein
MRDSSIPVLSDLSTANPLLAPAPSAGRLPNCQRATILAATGLHPAAPTAAIPRRVPRAGVSICYAAQAGSQLDAIYGPLQGRAIRDVTPAVLIMYGSHERELMESAVFWAGKAPAAASPI